MTKFPAVAALAVMLLHGAAGLHAIGTIVFLDGSVEVVRDGSDLAAVQIGTAIEPADTIQTGADGFVEIELDADGVRGALVVTENTSMVFDGSTGAARSLGRVNVYNGSIAANITQNANNADIQFRSQSVVLGVRGTQFDVVVGADEATLVGVREGTVALLQRRSEVPVIAGSVAEIAPDADPAIQSVPLEDFAAFYDNWREARLQIFRRGAATFVQAYATRFRGTEPDFRAALQDLRQYRQQLEEVLSAPTIDRSAAIQLRARMSPAILRVRSTLPLYEATVYRLVQLARFHDEGFGRVDLEGSSSTEFFREFQRRLPDLRRQLSEARALQRRFAELEQRSLGGGIPSNSNPFGDDVSLF